MKLADYIVLLLVATAVSFALHLMRSRKKNGSCCGGGTNSPCGTCGGCCGAKTEQPDQQRQHCTGSSRNRKA